MREGRFAHCWQTAGQSRFTSRKDHVFVWSGYPYVEPTLLDALEQDWSREEDRCDLFVKEVDGMSGREAFFACMQPGSSAHHRAALVASQRVYLEATPLEERRWTMLHRL